VAVFSENRLEWAVVDFAILAIGAVNVPIYPTLPPGQAGFILKDSGASLVFVSAGMQLEKIEEIRDRLDPNLKIVAFEPSGWFRPPSIRWATGGHRSWKWPAGPAHRWTAAGRGS
jgi:long-chain acyl-CoA synthetase